MFIVGVYVYTYMCASAEVSLKRYFAPKERRTGLTRYRVFVESASVF